MKITDYGTWEKALDVGRSYLVGGTMPMPEFLRVDTSSLNEWQHLAYMWCVANASRMLVLTSTKPRLIYHIAKRGEDFHITATVAKNTGSAAMARPRF